MGDQARRIVQGGSGQRHPAGGGIQKRQNGVEEIVQQRLRVQGGRSRRRYGVQGLLPFGKAEQALPGSLLPGLFDLQAMQGQSDVTRDLVEQNLSFLSGSEFGGDRDGQCPVDALVVPQGHDHAHPPFIPFRKGAT